MKRTGLILLACLLLALPAVAQAPEKAAPGDLVVTAEIVGYSREPGYTNLWGKKELPYICLYAKINVRNNTNQIRSIIMYSCAWPDSWIASGSQGFFNATYVSACDKNYLAPVPIPAGDALVFYCPLFLMNGYLIRNGAKNDAAYFKLGFLDFATTDDLSRSADKKISDKIKKARAVYWSNGLSEEIDPATVKELTRNSRYFSYHYESER